MSEHNKVEALNSLNARYEVLYEQMKLVEQQILELKVFGEELETIEKNKNEEIMVPLGKSVFASAKLDVSKKFLVDIGAGHFIKKDISETKSVIVEQEQRLQSFKVQLSSEIDNIANELQKLII